MSEETFIINGFHLAHLSKKNKEESFTTFLFVSNSVRSPNILVEDQSLISLVAKEEEESL